MIFQYWRWIFLHHSSLLQASLCLATVFQDAWLELGVPTGGSQDAGSLATWPIQHRFQKPGTRFGGRQEGEATCVYLTATYLKDKSPQSKPPFYSPSTSTTYTRQFPYSKHPVYLRVNSLRKSTMHIAISDFNQCQKNGGKWNSIRKLKIIF